MSGLCWFGVLSREALGLCDRPEIAIGPAAVKLLAPCCVVAILGLLRRFPTRRGGVEGLLAFGSGTAWATTTLPRGVYGGDFLVLLFKLSDDALDAHGYGRRRAAASLGVASFWSCMAAREVWRHCATTTRVVVFVIDIR